MVELLGSALPQLAERIIALLREGKRERRDTLEQQVDPIFALLKQVVDDYEQVFAELEADIADESIPLGKTIDRLLIRRHAALPLRDQVFNFSLSIDSAHDAEVLQFSKACRALIRRDPGIGRPRYPDSGGLQSSVTSLIDEMFEAAGFYVPPEGVIEQIESNKVRTDAINDASRELCLCVVRANRRLMEAYWSSAARYYYQLRLRLLR